MTLKNPINIKSSNCTAIVQQLYSNCTAIEQQLYSNCTAIVQQLYSNCTAIVQRLYSNCTAIVQTDFNESVDFLYLLVKLFTSNSIVLWALQYYTKWNWTFETSFNFLINTSLKPDTWNIKCLALLYNILSNPFFCIIVMKLFWYICF